MKTSRVILSDNHGCSGMYSGGLPIDQQIAFAGRKRTIIMPVLLRDPMKIEDKDTSRRVFVSNLPTSMNDDEFVSLISNFGAFHLAYLIRALPNSRKAFGFVSFDNKISTAKAIEKKSLKYGKNRIYIRRYDKRKLTGDFQKVFEADLSNHLWNQNQIRLPVFSKDQFAKQYTCYDAMAANFDHGVHFRQLLSTRSEQKTSSLEFQMLLHLKPQMAMYQVFRNDQLEDHHTGANLRFNQPQSQNIFTSLASKRGATIDNLRIRAQIEGMLPGDAARESKTAIERFAVLNTSTGS